VIDMNLEQIEEKGSKNLFQNYGRMSIAFSHGQGAYLYDTEGKEYLDLVAGIAVNSIGHSHPAWVKAVSEQAAKLCHVSNLYHIQEQALLAESLASIAPDGLCRSLFVNSGAEANEAALKLAVKHTGKKRIVSAMDSFHGRTAAALGATGQTKYQSGFRSLISDVFHYFPFGDPEALKEAMDKDTAALLLEPIQGESGVRTASTEFFHTARDLCDELGALLIMDEVQTGIGRTGEWFGCNHHDVLPDIISVAKGLGGGFPIGAIISTDELSATFGPGAHGTTFGGSPLACASASAVLSIILEEGLVGNAARVGGRILQGLAALQHPDIIEVRGQGLMIGLEMKSLAKPFQDFALQQGVLVNVCHGNVVRLVPPLNIGREEADRFLALIQGFLAENP